MAGIIAKRSIEEIRLRNNVVDVVGSYLPLQRSGAAFKTLCPFHKEKTPSFSVNQERQIFHCFGCGAGGDIFGFVMQYEGVDFATAAKILAGKAGIKLEYEAGSGDNESDKSGLYDLLAEVSQFYQRILLKSEAGKPARKYLSDREITDEYIKEFQIGFVPDRWDSVILWAQKHKYSTADLESGGLVAKSAKVESKRGFYDRFRNRVMFPIHDSQSRVIGFSGRVLTGDQEGAKYVNTPETALFHKSQVLYALHLARHHIVDKREAMICEGQIDVIRCHMAGFKNAVAAQGTAFTEQHARTVKRYADSVALVFDSDKAGQDASIKAARVFIQAGLAVRIVKLPEGEDPDSFIRTKGQAAFQGLLDNALSALEFQVRVLQSRENMNSEVGLMRASRALLQTIAETPNAIQRAKLIQEAAVLLNIPVDALQHELQHLLRRPVPVAAGNGAKEPVKIIHPAEEIQLAEQIVAAPELGALVRKYLPQELFSDRHCADVIFSAIEAAEKNRNLMAVIAERDDPDGGLARLAAELQMAETRTRGRTSSRELAVKDLILKIVLRRHQKQREEVEQQWQTGKGKADASLRMRHAQLTSDLKLLQKWETALPLLELQHHE